MCCIKSHAQWYSVYICFHHHIQVVKFDYGKQDENPIDEMRFYAKGELDEAFKVSI